MKFKPGDKVEAFDYQALGLTPSWCKAVIVNYCRLYGKPGYYVRFFGQVVDLWRATRDIHHRESKA